MTYLRIKKRRPYPESTSRVPTGFTAPSRRPFCGPPRTTPNPVPLVELTSMQPGTDKKLFRQAQLLRLHEHYVWLKTQHSTIELYAADANYSYATQKAFGAFGAFDFTTTSKTGLGVHPRGRLEKRPLNFARVKKFKGPKNCPPAAAEWLILLELLEDIQKAEADLAQSSEHSPSSTNYFICSDSLQIVSWYTHRAPVAFKRRYPQLLSLLARVHWGWIPREYIDPWDAFGRTLDHLQEPSVSASKPRSVWRAHPSVFNRLLYVHQAVKSIWHRTIAAAKHLFKTQKS